MDTPLRNRKSLRHEIWSPMGCNSEAKNLLIEALSSFSSEHLCCQDSTACLTVLAHHIKTVTQNFTLLHSEWPKLHRVLAILSAVGLRCQGDNISSLYFRIGEIKKTEVNLHTICICMCKAIVIGLTYEFVSVLLFLSRFLIKPKPVLSSVLFNLESNL